jgi:hypothetical protein
MDNKVRGCILGAFRPKPGLESFGSRPRRADFETGVGLDTYHSSFRTTLATFVFLDLTCVIRDRSVDFEASAYA